MWPCIETKPLAGNSEKKAKQKSKALSRSSTGALASAQGKRTKKQHSCSPAAFTALPECQGLCTQRAKSQANTELEQFSHLR